MAETYYLHIPSEQSSLARVEAFLMNVPAITQLDEHRRFNLMVASLEALSNAIVHGNRSNAHTDVDVVVTVADESITVRIRDYGEGFDPSRVPDPRHQENLLREGGRGVFLITALADTVEFVQHNPGMEVVITMYR